MSRRGGPLAALALAVCSLGWLDPSATPREAARSYADGKFDDAATKYNQALVDEPDSTLLHFNLGDAEYRRKQWEASARAFASLPQDAAAQYNQGNALYQMGVAAEQDKPQDALKSWAEALVAYRRAIATDSQDEDAKFNYEWVSRKIDELKKKLEEQQQKQDQQQNQDQNKQDQSQQDPQKQQQDQNEQDQADQQKKDEEQKDQQQAQDQRKPEDQQQAGQQPDQKQQEQPSQQDQQQAQRNQQPSGGEQQQAQGGEAQPADGELSRDEATALLDGERNEELRPDEVIRRQLGSGEGPVQDW